MGSTTVQAPAPRNIAQETGETLATQIALAPQQYDAYAEYAPKYAQTDINTLGAALFGQGYNGTLSDINQRLTQESSLQSQQANTAQRAADVADVGLLGGQVAQIRQNLNPLLFQNMGQFQASAFGAVPQNASADMAAQNAAAGFGSPLLAGLNQRAQGSGMSPLLQQQNEIAAQQLALGGNLSDSELRNVQQSSRAGFAARGLGATNASVTDEVLQTDAARRQRLLQSLGIASGVEAQNQGAMGLQNALGLGVQSANLGAGTAQQQALSQAAQFAEMQRQFQAQQQQQAIANQQATFFDPFQGVLGRSSGNVGTNQGLFGNAGGVTGQGNAYTQQMFNPMNPYAQDLYNTNYNAQAAANIGTANNQAAQSGSLIGAAGTLGGAAIGAKLFFFCIPEGEQIDTPEGRRNIEDIRAGDTVTGYEGEPVRVLMKHEYAENPFAERFIRFTAKDGASFAVCDKHRIGGVPAKDVQMEADVTSQRFGGVTRSYDLLTEDAGYQMAGFQVNSMINEMHQYAEKLSNV